MSGHKYIFHTEDSSNSGHELGFTTSNTTYGFADGITFTGTPGNSGSRLTFDIPVSLNGPVYMYSNSAIADNMGIDFNNTGAGITVNKTAPTFYLYSDPNYTSLCAPNSISFNSIINCNNFSIEWHDTLSYNIGYLPSAWSTVYFVI